VTAARRSPLARLGLVAVAVVLGGLAVVGLAAATQNRPDPRVAGTTSVVTFDVRVGERPGGEEAAALSLWAVCEATLGNVDVSPVAPAGDAWSATVAPAIGEHAHRRLLGCVEDLTLPRVRGELVSVVDLP
jgi:hypothetical protein